MRAAVVHAFDQPLRIEEVPVPEPAHGQVVVRMETCGICHTDIHAAHGDWPVKPAPPFIPGHEAWASSTGSVRGHHLRRRRPRRHSLAGLRLRRLRVLRLGTRDPLRQARELGYSVNGAYAEYALADASFVERCPRAWTRSTPPRSRARGDHLQGGQSVGCAFDGPRRRLRHRRPRASGRAVREDRRCLGRRRRPHRFEAGARHRPRRRIRLQRRHRGPGRGHRGAWRRRPGDRARRVATACEQAYRSLKRGGRSSWSGCRRTTSWPCRSSRPSSAASP